MRAWLLAGCLLLVLLLPSVGATAGYVQLPVGTDLVFFANARDASTPTTFDLILTEWRDCDNNGDFAGVGCSGPVATEENALVTLAQVTNCTGASAHLACKIVANTGVVVLWKNTSSHQVPGSNGTLRVVFRDGLGVRTGVDTLAFKVLPAASNPVTVTDLRASESRVSGNVTGEHQGTRARVNSTATTTQELVTAEAQGTRALVNSTRTEVVDEVRVHNSTQDHSHGGPAGGTCDTACQQNITEGVVTNLTVTRNGDVFALGHVSTLQDTFVEDMSVAAILLVALWFGLFVWTARNQWLFPAAFAMAGMVLPLVVDDFGFAHKALFSLFLIGLILTWVADRFRLQSGNVEG